LGQKQELKKKFNTAATAIAKPHPKKQTIYAKKMLEKTGDPNGIANFPSIFPHADKTSSQATMIIEQDDPCNPKAMVSAIPVESSDADESLLAGDMDYDNYTQCKLIKF
jgi:hypothetical protein